MLFRWVVISCCITISASGLFAEENDELNREIVRLENEISRVKAQRREEAQHVKKENWEFADYQKRTARRISTITARTDSLQQQLQQASLFNDSLSARLDDIKTAIHEEQLHKRSLGHEIIKAVQTLRDKLNSFPPMIREQYTGSLSYLIGEVKGGTVENTEALHRLMRIVGDVRTVAQEIQVLEGTSPLQEVRGTVARLRIGAVFEAVYDQKSNSAYVWIPPRDTVPEGWQTVDDESSVAAIAKTIQMREGKVVPELLALPFGKRENCSKGGDNENN